MIAFFIRGYNDVDHLVPIVWKMSSRDIDVNVYSLSPDFNIDNDYRLNFLRDVGVSVTHAYGDQYLTAGLFRKSLWTLINFAFKCSHKFNDLDKPIFSRISRGLGWRMFLLLKSFSFGTAHIENFLNHRSIKVLCFDWVRPENTIVSGLLYSAKRLGCPSISLPHGVTLCTNDDIAWNSDPSKSIGWRNALDDPFDKVVVQYSFYERYLIHNNSNSSKVVVLGSARYCDEWICKNIDIAPRVMKADAYRDSRLKCVFMATRIQYKVDVELMRSMFNRLRELDDTWVTLKPHTRSSSEGEIYSDVGLDDLSHVSSVELCQWADVVIVIASSVMIEALHQKKVVLYLKYLHSNDTLHEEYRDCWVIESEDALVEALKRLQKDKTDFPYNRTDSERFLLDVTKGGVSDRDVLNDYSNVISQLKMDRV